MLYKQLNKPIILKIMTKDLLALSIGDIINKAVREKRGRLTEISDLSVINRQEFDPEGIANLAFYQIIRLGKAIIEAMPKKRIEQLKMDISKAFWDSIEGKEDDTDGKN